MNTYCRPYPRWRINIMPFSTPLWLAVIVSMLISSFILFTIDYITMKMDMDNRNRSTINLNNLWLQLQKYPQTLTDVYALFVQQPVVHASYDSIVILVVIKSTKIFVFINILYFIFCIFLYFS